MDLVEEDGKQLKENKNVFPHLFYLFIYLYSLVGISYHHLKSSSLLQPIDHLIGLLLFGEY